MRARAAAALVAVTLSLPSASAAPAKAQADAVAAWQAQSEAGLLPERKGLPSMYDCGVCELLAMGESCEKLHACGKFPLSTLRPGGCVEAGICKQQDKPPKTAEADAPSSWNLRVAKGMMSRPYNQVRVSMITESASAPDSTAHLSYSAKFQNAWTNYYLHSGLVEVTPGEPFSLGTYNNKSVSINIPIQGAGVSGLLIADPCINQTNLITWVSCINGEKLHTDKRIPELLSVFGADKDTDYWGILGDNFYDHKGELSKRVFGQIDAQALAKVQLAVPGNHDYWILGGPQYGNRWDQCANGFMQWYGQDVFASQHQGVGSAESPFNTSVNPSKGHLIFGCNPPVAENFFFYNQVGNIGFLGQSGAYEWDRTLPMVSEACAAFAKTNTVQVVMLLGHWDISELGSETGMDMPAFYDRVKAVPGCDAFEKVGMLKFFMGHTHCNQPHPRGKVGEGFRVAGFGMEGCGNFGAPMIDTSNGRIRVQYFDLQHIDAYTAGIACVKAHGWKSDECRKFSTLWIDEPIKKRGELPVENIVI